MPASRAVYPPGERRARNTKARPVAPAPYHGSSRPGPRCPPLLSTAPPLGLCAPTPRFSRQMPRETHPPPAARRFARRSLPASAVPPHAPRRSQRAGSASSRPVCVCTCFCTSIHHLRRLRSFPLATTAQTMALTTVICHTPHLHSKLTSTLP
ncbi:hypothetical protein C8J57DRAFT_1582105 [Mycena rebaudengoi]|nr:hypothetical protein C8J57DRAFT_1582105 [Mycena rebaudengoi]